VALGLADGDRPDRLAIGLAVLTLLSEASTGRPTICVIDDAQWVDVESLQALAFVARRPLVDPIVMIFATREARGDRILADLPELALRGLGVQDARAVLAATVPGGLNEQVRDNIIVEAGGNPLSLMDVHHVLSPAELAGGFGLAGATRLTNRLELALGHRIDELAPATTEVLLIAAADPTGEATWLAAAVRELGVPVDAVETADVPNLVSIGGRVRFRHPLIRSAVYRRSSLSERRRVHRALVKVVDGPNAEVHRAWHLAHATAMPDERVAEQVERAAEEVRVHSGVAAAAAFLELAVDLTPDRERRVQRVLSAAQAKLDAGAPEAAWKLLMSAQYATDDELSCVKIELLSARSAQASGQVGDATANLLAIAARLDGVDTVLASETYLEALTAAVLEGRMARGPDCSAVTVAAAARRAHAATESERVVDLLLDGVVARIIDGHVAAAARCKRAINELLNEDPAGVVDVRWYDLAAVIALDLFDHPAFDRITGRRLELLRSSGAIAPLPSGLHARAAADVFDGRFSDAAAHLSEAKAITDVISGLALRASDALLAAYRGQKERCRDLTHGAVEHGPGFRNAEGLLAIAVSNNGAGRYSEALSACHALFAYDDPGVSGHALVETVEAATRCGDRPAAVEALGRLVERAEASGTDTALGLAARSRGLISDGAVAEAEYLSAIEHLERSPALVYLARTHLVYGEWLRRQSRRVDARAALRIALGMFVDMGAEGFAERTRRELEATAEIVRKRTGDAAVELTLHETHIARLARDGLTNPEIAARLFISVRTVEWHMSKIFTKLGVASRKELRRNRLLVT
jgi:DNA-binding CsgD family transcriptional regulator